MTKQKEHSFSTCYVDFCRKNRTRPLPIICVTLPNSLDFITDRIKLDDWKPILSSLSLDQTLKSVKNCSKFILVSSINFFLGSRSINVRSKYQFRKILEYKDEEKMARAIAKAPVILHRSVLDSLCHSLAQCEKNSANLIRVELDGIPLPPDCVAVLCLGLNSTKSLQHLSLQRCHIGDDGCEMIFRTIPNVRSLKTLNLAFCNLSSKSGTSIANGLSKQKLKLYHDAWAQSLRYREPQLDKMNGLKRITLNGNSGFGDEGFLEMVEVVRDNLWFKALDCQRCGLTNAIFGSVQSLLEQNKILEVLDIRLNPGIEEQVIVEIMEKLARNHGAAKTEYQWMKLPSSDKKPVVQKVKPLIGQVVKKVTLTPIVLPRKIKPKKETAKTKSIQIQTDSKISLCVDLQTQIGESVGQQEEKKEFDAQQQIEDLKRENDRLIESMENERMRREALEEEMSRIRERIEKQEQDYLLVDKSYVEAFGPMFQTIFERLERCSMKRNLPDLEEESDEPMTTEDFRRKVALIIRKTRSESIRREKFEDDDTFMTKSQMNVKFGKSDVNIRSRERKREKASLPLDQFSIEHNIGDSAECHRFQLLNMVFEDGCRERKDQGDGPTSSKEKARAIFDNFITNDNAPNIN